MAHHDFRLVVTNVNARDRFGDFIDGKWVNPLAGEYFTDHRSINGGRLTEIASSKQALDLF